MLPEQMHKMAKADQNLAEAIRDMTKNLAGEPATNTNVADGLYAIAAAIETAGRRVAKAMNNSKQVADPAVIVEDMLAKAGEPSA